jgi:hypothetical protein
LEVEGQNYNPPVSKIVYELIFKQWSKQEADPKVVEAESAKLEKVSSGRDELQPVRLASANLAGVVRLKATFLKITPDSF